LVGTTGEDTVGALEVSTSFLGCYLGAIGFIQRNDEEGKTLALFENEEEGKTPQSKA